MRQPKHPDGIEADLSAIQKYRNSLLKSLQFKASSREPSQQNSLTDTPIANKDNKEKGLASTEICFDFISHWVTEGTWPKEYFLSNSAHHRSKREEPSLHSLRRLKRREHLEEIYERHSKPAEQASRATKSRPSARSEACLQTLEGYSNSANLVAVSYNST